MEKIWEIEFIDDLITGFEVIDEAHKQIAQRANKLYELCNDLNTTKKDLIDSIQITQDELCFHFDKEIELYEFYNLEDVSSHKKQHDEFKDIILDINTRPSPLLVKGMMLNQLILYYLKEHLLKSDKIIIAKINQIN